VRETRSAAAIDASTPVTTIRLWRFDFHATVSRRRDTGDSTIAFRHPDDFAAVVQILANDLLE
jgi:hypothetical protein